MIARIVWGVLVAAVAAATFASLAKAHPNWDNDGFLYARMLLVDRGMSEDEAHATASRFYLSGPRAHAPGAELFGANPPRLFVTQYPLFRARKLYPWLASLLYPKFGLDSLLVVSVVSGTLAAVTIYLILLCAGPPWLAALGAIAATGYPLMHEIGTSAATDAPALLGWVLCLAATIAYARTRGAVWLVCAIAAAVLLASTRPAFWLPPGAAAGLVVYAYRKRDPMMRAAAMRLFAAQAAVVIAALGYTAAQHGAGFVELLNWQYEWHIEHHARWVQYGIAGWYVLKVLRGFVVEPIELAAAGTPVLAVAAAAIGLWRRRDDPAVAVLIGAAAVAPLAILANPPDFARALELPMIPVVMFGVVALLADGIRADRSADPVAAAGSA